MWYSHGGLKAEDVLNIRERERSGKHSIHNIFSTTTALQTTYISSLQIESLLLNKDTNINTFDVCKRPKKRNLVPLYSLILFIDSIGTSRLCSSPSAFVSGHFGHYFFLLFAKLSKAKPQLKICWLAKLASISLNPANHPPPGKFISLLHLIK